MKFKKIISVLLASAMIFAIMTVNAFAATRSYTHVVNQHEYIENVDCYTFSGYDIASDAYAYAMMTTQTNTSMTLRARVSIDVDYADNTYGYSTPYTIERTISKKGGGIQAYSEIYFEGVARTIYYYHYYYLNGSLIHSRIYDVITGVSND